MMRNTGFIEAATRDATDYLERRFASNVSIPSLQELASYQVALKIWYNFIARPEHKDEKGRPLSDNFLSHYCRTESYKLVELLGTPQSIEQIIKNCLDTIRRAMDSCVWHFKSDIFIGNLRRYYTDIFSPNYCFWFQNGTVDYKRTALKLLSNPELSKVQKFIIMCKYCMEYELSSISVNDFTEEFIREATFEDDFLVFYWICRLRNELDRIPLQNMSSIDAVMAANCKYELWLAFEYFWNRLGADEQISVAVTKLSQSWLFQSILTKMSLSQQRQLIHRIPVDIILNFWLHLHMPAEALEYRLLAKHIMIEERLDNKIRGCLEFEIAQEFDAGFLINLLDGGSDRLKNYCVRVCENLVMTMIVCCGSNLPPDSLKLLREFLSPKDEKSRIEFLLKVSDKICQFDRPQFMMDVVKFCLTSDEEIFLFKKSVANSRSMRFRFATLLNLGRFDNLRALLNVYLPDEQTSRELVRILLSEELWGHEFVPDLDRWNKLSEFIDSTFPNDTSLTSRMKKDIIWSFAVECRYLWNNEAALNEMIKVVEVVFDVEELAAFKLTVLDTFRRVMMREIFHCDSFWKDFNGKFCQDFLSWCLGGEEKIEEFKNTVSIDDLIIHRGFGREETWEWDSETDCGYFEPGLFFELDKCLGWYFTNVDEMKKYKVRKINELNLNLLHRIVEIRDEESLKILLCWFFDDDREAIDKFRSEKLEALRR